MLIQLPTTHPLNYLYAVFQTFWALLLENSPLVWWGSCTNPNSRLVGDGPGERSWAIEVDKAGSGPSPYQLPSHVNLVKWTSLLPQFPHLESRNNFPHSIVTRICMRFLRRVLDAVVFNPHPGTLVAALPSLKPITNHMVSSWAHWAIRAGVLDVFKSCTALCGKHARVPETRSITAQTAATQESHTWSPAAPRLAPASLTPPVSCFIPSLTRLIAVSKAYLVVEMPTWILYGPDGG